MLILGIETSCDETAAALVRDGREVLASVVDSQIAQHQPYGGVVPEIASRGHVDSFPRVVSAAFEKAGCRPEEVDAIAVTHGPGLVSSLLIGVAGARALGQALNKPVWGVNHLEGHLAAAFLDPAIPGPEVLGNTLVLMVSGGHTCLITWAGMGRYRILGHTLDDAAGECLDKGAKMMGLGYPGGPAIEQAAKGGDATYIRFPRGMEHAKAERTGDGRKMAYCFSFSGLKTALLYHLKKQPEDLQTHPADVAASYQAAVVEALVRRTETALADTGAGCLLCVGGVAKNAVLRARLDEICGRRKVALRLAPLAYCTDNAAMIAAAAGLRALAGLENPPAREADPTLMLEELA